MRFIYKVTIPLGVAIITACLCYLRPIEEIDLTVGDRLRRLVGKTPPPSNVILIALDEASYREFGVSFDSLWPRDLHARLLKRLKELGVARVAFDVLFTSHGADPKIDGELTEAFKLNETILGAEPSRRQLSNSGTRYDDRSIELPIREFSQVAQPALVGLDMISQDGLIRNFPSSELSDRPEYPFLAFAAAGVSKHPEWRLPGPRDLIKYYGSARQNARVISYWEMFQEMAPRDAALFKDAIVFIGLLLRSDTGPAQKDSYFSPFGDNMIFGVEIHAAIAGNLIEQSWIYRPAKSIEVLCQSAIAAAISFAAFTISPIMLTYVVIVLALLWIVSGYFMLKSGVFLAGAATALLILPGMVLISAVTSYLKARRLAEEARQREEAIRTAFSLYVSPEVLPKLHSNKLSLGLGGESMVLTAMFTDIADFTAISESMPAEQTSQMLNAYFSEVMDVVFANQGTLLKFIGDAIFAIWGAPVKVDNHAELALKTAVAIQEGVERFNASRRFPPLATRVGVHTGTMLVGNLGSSKRFDYTAIGDSVNLTSRLEGLNKYLGTTVLFSEATRIASGGILGSLPMARVIVKGRHESVLLHSIFEPALPEESVVVWVKALEAFSARRFEEARSNFTEIISKESRLATAAALYLEHLNQFIKKAPNPDWDGAIEFTSK
jgi:adenylate cyclase